jgi:glycosyltransferase involved in cell wall biosynthesis
MNNFEIVIPFRNVASWITLCANSVFKQNYPTNKFCVSFVDDCSDDNTNEILEKIIKKYKDTHCSFLTKNESRKYKIVNLREAIKERNMDDNSVIIIIDGDDWLAGPNVLNKLDEVYTETDCMMTYGSYMEYPSYVRGKFSSQLPEFVIATNSYRKYMWCTSHLATFKHSLWKEIREEELKDWDGKYFKASSDLATMFPMLEMSGNRSKFVDDILYVYNTSNPFNDHKVDHEYQLKAESYIRNNPPREK